MATIAVFPLKWQAAAREQGAELTVMAGDWFA